MPSERYREGDEDGRNASNRQSGGLERHVQTLISGLVLIGIVGLTTFTISSDKSLAEIKIRSEVATQSAARLEAQITALDAKLLTMDRTIQATVFKQDDFDRRLKGLEMIRERLK